MGLAAAYPATLSFLPKDSLPSHILLQEWNKQLIHTVNNKKPAVSTDWYCCHCNCEDLWPSSHIPWIYLFSLHPKTRPRLLTFPWLASRYFWCIARVRDGYRNWPWLPEEPQILNPEFSQHVCFLHWLPVATLPSLSPGYDSIANKLQASVCYGKIPSSPRAAHTINPHSPAAGHTCSLPPRAWQPLCLLLPPLP